MLINLGLMIPLEGIKVIDKIDQFS